MVVRSVATFLVLALTLGFCGCRKADPYAKLDDALAQFGAALQGPMSQAEFVERVATVKAEWRGVADKLEAVGDFSDDFAKRAWARLDYSCQTDDFNRADLSRGRTSVSDLREYLNRLRLKQHGTK